MVHMPFGPRRAPGGGNLCRASLIIADLTVIAQL
jgi:hypothetical protein